MRAPLILAHDIGTSGTKSALVRPDGAIVASQTSAHQTHFPRPGWAEQRPEDWWEGVCRNTAALTAGHPGLCRHIAAIGTSGHMLGCLPVDAAGRALRPCMIHSDCRASGPCQVVGDRIGAAAIYELTGNILDPRSSLCKVLWVKEHEPQVYERTARFLQSKDYIVGRMTGSCDSTDYSDASHAQWLDIRAKSYAAGVFAELGIESAKFSVQSADATSLGAAFAAGVGVGLFDGLPQAAQTIEVTGRRVADSALAERYERFFRVYQALYPRLQPVFAQLRESRQGNEQVQRMP